MSLKIGLIGILIAILGITGCSGTQNKTGTSSSTQKSVGKKIYPKEAVAFYKQELAMELKKHGEDHKNVSGIRNVLGLFLIADHKPDEAIPHLEKALASDLKNSRDDDPFFPTILNNLGLAWYEKGDYDKAIEYYKRNLESNQKIFGPGHPNSADAKKRLDEVIKERDEKK